MVWKAAARDKQKLMESLLDSKLIAESRHGSGAAFTSEAPPLLTSAQRSDPQKRFSFKCASPQHNNSVDEMQKNGMDFYC